jgi:indole-3-glycerol phosphate synthase
VVEAQSKLPLAELRRLVEEQKVNVRGGPAFPLVNFPSRILVSAPAIAVLAEVKRASPSKGDIAPGIIIIINNNINNNTHTIAYARTWHDTRTAHARFH